MYSTCLFCSAELGTNEAIESFPVGARVAFDAWKGRLWAVCGRCGRWNLAPIEERWEAVETADRLFTDTRTRVQSDNIGLARLPDGTRLVRIGSALPGEIAAWRYGGQLVSRRNRNFAMFGGAAVIGGAVVVGLPLIASMGVPITLVNAGLQMNSLFQQQRQRKRVVHRVCAADSPTGRELVIRRSDLYDAVLATDDSGMLALNLPARAGVAETRKGWQGFGRFSQEDGDPIRISGDAARVVVARSMTDYNSTGGSRADVEQALRAIGDAGGADAFALKTAASGAAIVKTAQARRPSVSIRQVLGTFRGEVLPITKHRDLMSWNGPRLSKVDALALEIALQEETERRALEGELAALEAAWREAEEIAHIADALPGEPPAQQHE